MTMCSVTQGPVRRRDPCSCLVSCFVVAILKFLQMFGQIGPVEGKETVRKLEAARVMLQPGSRGARGESVEWPVVDGGGGPL